MADTKISNLTELTAVSGEDLLVIVDDPSGSPVTKKATVNSLFTSIITGSSASIGANVNFGTDYISGPSLVLSSGVWFVTAHAMFQGRNTANAMGVNMRISDGTNHYAVARAVVPQNYQQSLSCSAIILLTGTSTIILQAGNGSVAENSAMLYRDPVDNIEDASTICAVRLI